jgi:phosphate transport system permease protein
MTTVASPIQSNPSASITGRRSFGDRAFARLALLAGLSVLAILVLIAWATTKEAWPILRTHAAQFLFTSRWAPEAGHYGSAALVYGTLLTSVIALVFAVPVSIGIALFTTELAPPWLRKPLVSVMDILAVIPSVVFGLWGILVVAKPAHTLYTHIADIAGHIPIVGRVFGLYGGKAAGSSFFTAGLILAVMIVPIITSLTREVIATTPASEKEAALALGATRWEMIRGAVIPHSKGGIVGAVTLGLGRAMGETIAAALVIGASVQVSSHVFAPGYSLPSIIANEFGDADPLKRAALIACGVLLFVLTIIVNVAANAIVQRSIKRSRGA